MTGRKAAFWVALVIALVALYFAFRLIMGMITNGPRALLYALGGTDQQIDMQVAEAPEGYAVPSDSYESEADFDADAPTPAQDETIVNVPVEETIEQLAKEADAEGL